MKIRQARISSYGKLRERDFSFDDGLNVVYGPNEAGKSTLRSFLTTTIFPKAPLKYPASKTSDSGSVDVVTEEGNKYTFNREGKKSSGLGSQLCEIDDKEYVSIYSMSPDDLRDVKGIEKGDIRNRFLTIPGGNDLPRVYDEIDQARTKLLPDQRRNAKCGIATLISEDNDLRQNVRRLQAREAGDVHYAELVERKKVLERQIGEKGIAVQGAQNDLSAASRHSGRSKDLAKISELEQEESKIRYAEKVDTEKYAVLNNDLGRKKEALDNAEGRLEISKRSVFGLDIDAYLSVMPQIEHLRNMESEYDRAPQRIVPTAPVSDKIELHGLPMACILLIVIGILTAAFVHIGCIAITIVGVLLFLLSLRNNTASVPISTQSFDQNNNKTILEDELNEVACKVHLPRRDFHFDIRTLTNNLENIKEYLATEDKRNESFLTKKTAEDALSLFLSGYGGIDGYQRAVSDHQRLIEIRSQIQALKESTEGIETEVLDESTAREVFQQVNDQYAGLKSELATVEQSLKNLSADMSVEEAITAEAEANDRIYAACYEWASLMFEKIILDRASEVAYSAHRPEVLQRADGLLSIMTDGRYKLDTDPHRYELAVSEVSGGEIKTVTEWSSGLEDQVKLSVKMAVSLSLSKERPPIILDDVLLTTDSGRKKNACKAIAKIANEIQVIYFTCDHETFDFLRESGANVVSL